MQSQSKNGLDEVKYCKCSFHLANSLNSQVPPLFCELWHLMQNFPILTHLSPRKDASWMNWRFHPSSWAKDCFSFLSPFVLILNVPSNWALKLEMKRRKYVTTNLIPGLCQTPLTLLDLTRSKAGLEVEILLPNLLSNPAAPHTTSF